jgi:hypothetical protein
MEIPKKIEYDKAENFPFRNDPTTKDENKSNFNEIKFLQLNFN